MSKMYGKAIIELINSTTGEVETHIEKNMVTNLFKDTFRRAPFNSFGTQVANDMPYDSSKGICLFGENIEEDVNNYFINQIPLAWAGDEVNSGTTLERGSFNATESGVLDDGTGYRYVWDWATSQGNGTYKCIGLTSPQVGDMNGLFKFQKGRGILSVSYSPTLFSNCDTIYNKYNGYYDTTNGIKDVVALLDANTVRLDRYKRSLYDITLMNDFNTKPADLIFEKRYGLSTALLSPNFSIHYNNNIFYIISYTSNSNVLQITSIDITDINNPIIKQVSNTYSNAKFYYYKSDNSYVNTYSGYNKLPFSYPYVYVQSYNNNYTFYKININDSTDVSILETEITEYADYLSYGWSKISDRFMLQTGGAYMYAEEKKSIIDIVSNKIYCSTYPSEISRNEPFGGYAFGKYEVELANNIDNSPFMIYEANSYPQAYIIKNRWALFTINNLATAITKTSDQTMKITYTLSEQE